MPLENNQKIRGFLIFSGGMEKNVLAMGTHFPQISNVLVVRILLIISRARKISSNRRDTFKTHSNI